MRSYDASEEIKLAAKSGFLTKKVWNEFFGTGGARWRNCLWSGLSEKGLFRKHPSKYATDVLVLNSKNLVVRRLVGDEISAPPYISQMDHDETILRALLDLRRNKLIRNFRFEQEQKRESGFRYSDGGIPGRVKIPDALIEIGEGVGRTLAFELELSRKEPKRYRQMMDSLSSLKGVEKIIFITRTAFITGAIRKAMRESYYPYWERPIGFGTLEEWRANPVTAQISFEDEITSFEKLSRNKAS